jgi:type I restriction enzyme S subunit
METKLVKLSDVAIINPRLRLKKNEVARKIPMEALTPFQKNIDSYSFEKYSGGVKFQNGDTLVARITPSLENGKTSYVDILDADEVAFGSTEFIVLRANKSVLNEEYLYYIATSNNFRQVAIQSMTGTSGRQRVQNEAVSNYELELPSLDIQRQTVQILDAVDSKIELNQQINKSLLKLATMVFDNWVENTKSETITSLDKIATYQNGIAMQKFPPIDDNAVLPVLKIRELNQDCVDNNSDLVTSGVKENVKVHDGDLIFSWSGTLIAKLWTGGDAALNQHLFKVTSTRYPRWFYYLWTLRHLREFQHIAADKKTTMGHIKRKDLTDAKVKIPSAEEFTQLDTILSPMIQQILNSGIESKQLTQLRNILLPKLLAGDIDLSKIETVMNNA